MNRAARRLSLALFAAPLALALSACGSDDTAGEGASGDPVAEVAAPEGTQWADMMTKTDEGGYLMGNPDAPIKLVEFGALSCSHCADFAADSFETLRDEYVNSGRVSFELRLFMLNSFDIPAALLATCSTDEAVIPLAEQFWGAQRSFFEKGQAAGQAAYDQINNLPPEQRFAAVADVYGMTDFFAARGIARDQANQCLSNDTKASELAAQTQSASQTYEVTGTPTFLINNRNIGSMGWEALEAELQKAGAR
ncbi:thioredoxin domain-containing protein [Croceicoccus naphthovorans]|nr:thioredoxin domain-containing protein [Croceicoccus naphthovorans]MBB3988723.1 protein-disulfide isomerase [Croceicoccus naphthovorans]